MELTHISIEKLKSYLETRQPKLIFVIGKTCTGKSTFAKSLKMRGYSHLELDFTVIDSVVKRYKVLDQGKAFLVYKGMAKSDWQKSFENDALKLIQKNLTQSKVVVDAAFADPGVLKKIITKGCIKDFEVIYFHPINKESYCKGILSRFIDDIKTNKHSFYIWDEVTNDILDDYYKNGESGLKVTQLVNKYGEESMNLSVDRLNKFKKVFPEIILTGY